MIIAVAFGGDFAESDVSRASADAIIETLENFNYKVFPLEMKKNQSILQYKEFILSAFREGKFDIIFNTMHGTFGEDGQLSEFCEENKIPFTHSKSIPSKIAIDKAATKEVMIKNNILTAKYILITKNEILWKKASEIIKNTALNECKKIVIKPRFGGSTVDCFIISDLERILTQDEFQTDETDFIVEEFIVGREFTVGILNNEVMPYIMEIIPQKSGYFDYASKYTEGGAVHLEAKDLSPEIKTSILDQSKLLHTAIGLDNVSRVDLIFAEYENKAYFLEINNVPGMTYGSLIPDIATKLKITFIDVLRTIMKTINK